MAVELSQTRGWGSVFQIAFFIIVLQQYPFFRYTIIVITIIIIIIFIIIIIYIIYSFFLSFCAVYISVVSTEDHPNLSISLIPKIIYFLKVPSLRRLFEVDLLIKLKTTSLAPAL